MFPTFTLNLTWPAFQEMRTQAGALEEIAACWQTDRTLTGTNQPAVLSTAGVSKQFFEELGARAQRGRLLSDADQEPGDDHVAVISDTLWRTRFAKDPAVIGRQLILDKQLYSVVGVAAKGFAFPETVEVWVPVPLTSEVERNPTFFAFDVIGRLRPKAKIETPQAELAIIASQAVFRERPNPASDYNITAKTLLDFRGHCLALPFTPIFSDAEHSYFARTRIHRARHSRSAAGDPRE